MIVRTTSTQPAQESSRRQILRESGINRFISFQTSYFGLRGQIPGSDRFKYISSESEVKSSVIFLFGSDRKQKLMQFSGSDGPVGVAGKFYDEAENASTPKRKSELYLQASKSYLFAASTVSNGSLKHSLAYLAATCAQSARQWGLKNAAVVNADGPDIVAGTTLNSQRLIILAHREHLRRVEHVCFTLVDMISGCECLLIGVLASSFRNNLPRPRSRLFGTC